MTSPRSARLRRVGRRLGLALATFAVAFGVLELCLRAFGLRPPDFPDNFGFAHQRAVDGPQGFELVPGGTAHWIYPAWAGGAEFEIVGRINSHGWRGPEPADPPSGPRIACAGDSFTFGTGVRDEETLPAQLGARLLADGVRGAEVLNWGVDGYDTQKEVLLVESRLPDWRPDVLVLVYFVNDAAHPDARELDPLPPLREFLVGLCGSEAPAPLAWLRERSLALEWAAQRLTFALVEGRQGAMEDAYYEESNPGWTLTREGLRRARELCRAQGCELLVALYPRLQRREGGLVTDAAYAHVAEFCRGEGIEVLDLSSAFEGQPVERMWVHPMDPHPDPRAHAMAARALAERLAALGWLED